MKLANRVTIAVVLTILLWGGSIHAQVRSVPARASQETPDGVTTNEYPPVTAPPESFFQKVREKDRDAARTFYKKYLVV